MEHSGEDRFAFASALIKEAGAFVLSHENESDNVLVKHTNDFVTIVDKETEEFIISRLSKAFPEDSFFGEEGGNRKGAGNGGRWVVDPIDGTVNFMHSFPDYTISIAWENPDGKLTFGLVYVPRQDELFSAYHQKGAFLNGRPISVSQSDLHRSLALCVPPHRHRELIDFYQERMWKILDMVSDLRSIGSAALSLCYVASGRCSIYYEMCLCWYDIAAGVIILEEAGGIVHLEKRDELWIHVAASTPDAYNGMLECIAHD